MRWQSLGFYCKTCIIGVIKDPECACQIQCQDNLLRGGQLGGSVSRHREGHHCRPPFWDPSSPTLLCDAGVSAAAHGRAHHRQHRPPVPRRPLKMATDNIKGPVRSLSEPGLCRISQLYLPQLFFEFCCIFPFALCLLSQTRALYLCNHPDNRSRIDKNM